MNLFPYLRSLGQSIWLDEVTPATVSSGALGAAIRERAVGGARLRPSMEGSLDEDFPDRLLERHPDASGYELYEAVLLQAARDAADAFLALYEESRGQQGFLSLGLAPGLAFNSGDLIEEAERVWEAVGRPNLMIEVPATADGNVAMETLLIRGIHVNATCLFSPAQYEASAATYVQALENSCRPEAVSSRATFEVGRLDVAADRALARLGTDRVSDLRGRIGVASGLVVLRLFERFAEASPAPEGGTPAHCLVYGQRGIRREGGHVQRILWDCARAGGVPSPRCLEALAAPATGTCLSSGMLKRLEEAAIEGGPPSVTASEEAVDTLAEVRELGVDLDALADELQAETNLERDRSLRRLASALDAKRNALFRSAA
ncbi:MAG: hypothetical protein HY900_33765 [Deltaproteobacteria bacterium]|nr:hypothetical protein [Deltaproteobacteria bacterium]